MPQKHAGPLKTERFSGAHLASLRLQPSQKATVPLLADPEYGRALELTDARTAFVGGRPVACFGVLELERDRGLAWALLDVVAPMKSVTRAALIFLDELDMPRIEAAVDADFGPGHHWIKMLGFFDETPNGMRNYRAGQTYHLYARIR